MVLIVLSIFLFISSFLSEIVVTSSLMRGEIFSSLLLFLLFSSNFLKGHFPISSLLIIGKAAALFSTKLLSIL